MMKYEIRNGRFHLPDHRSEAGFKDILKWQMSGSRQKWPKHVPNKTYPAPPTRVQGAALSATWVGHSTMLLQTAGLNILTDPFFSKRASPSQLIGPTRVRAPGLALDALPPIDVILLSHNHYDHMDKPALRSLAKAHKPVVFTPLNNASHLKGMTVAELDWQQSKSFGPLKITALPAWHWSKRTTRDTNKSLWSAFALQGPMGLIYFGADTGFVNGQTFRDMRQQFGPPRLSLLPIGAYEPRWFMAPQHMNPDEAVRAHLLLESQTSLAIHHGTVQLTDESIDAPAQALQAALAQHGVNPAHFRLCDIGETLAIG